MPHTLNAHRDKLQTFDKSVQVDDTNERTREPKKKIGLHDDCVRQKENSSIVKLIEESGNKNFLLYGIDKLLLTYLSYCFFFQSV